MFNYKSRFKNNIIYSPSAMELNHGVFSQVNNNVVVM